LRRSRVGRGRHPADPRTSVPHNASVACYQFTRRSHFNFLPPSVYL